MKFRIWGIVILSGFVLACNPSKEKADDKIVPPTETQKLYCDTLFSFALKLLEGEGVIYESDTAIKAKRPIFEGLFRFHDIVAIKEYPELVKAYDSSFFGDSIISGFYDNYKINIECYNNYIFFSKEDKETWKRWVNTENDSAFHYIPSSYYIFSKPLFSENSDHLAIEVHDFSRDGNSYVFKNENGKWKLVKSHLLWFS